MKSYINLKISKGWGKISDEIREGIERETQVKKTGGNKYLQLEARLGHTSTGAIKGDIVVYAIQNIKTHREAKEFYKGFVSDVEKYKANYKDKYPAKIMDAKEYVKQDIYIALQLHFRNEETHQLWKKIINSK